MVTTGTLHPHHLVFHLLELCLSTAPFFYSYASWLPVIRIHIGKTAANVDLSLFGCWPLHLFVILCHYLLLMYSTFTSTSCFGTLWTR